MLLSGQRSKCNDHYSVFVKRAEYQVCIVVFTQAHTHTHTHKHTHTHSHPHTHTHTHTHSRIDLQDAQNSDLMSKLQHWRQALTDQSNGSIEVRYHVTVQYIACTV